MKKRASLVLILLCIIYAMSFFHRATPAVLSLDLINDLNLTPVTFGMLGSFTMLGYAITQIPSGVLSDILGGRKTLVIYQCIAGLASIAFALSDSLSAGVLSRFILGLALAANVPAMKILASWFSAEQYSKANAILLSCGALGTILASAPLAYCTGLLGWRGALFAAGIVTFVLAGLTWLFVADSPNTIQFQKQEKKAKFVELFKLVLSQKNFIPAFFWFFGMIANMFVLATMWWGTFIMQVYGLSRAEAGLILTIMSVFSLVGNPLIAILSDSVFRSRKKVLLAITVITFVCYIPLIFFLSAIPTSLVFCLGGAIIVLSTASAPLLFTLVKESVPAECAGTAFGMINTGAPTLSFILQNIFGYLVVFGTGISGIEMGYVYAFSLLMLVNFGSFIAGYFIEDTLS